MAWRIEAREENFASGRALGQGKDIIRFALKKSTEEFNSQPSKVRFRSAILIGLVCSSLQPRARGVFQRNKQIVSQLESRYTWSKVKRHI